MYLLVQAVSGGSAVMRCAPVSLTAASAPSTVRFQASSSMMPKPSGDGQMSLLISFLLHSSWLGPQPDPFARVISAASAYSNEYIQQALDQLAEEGVVVDGEYTPIDVVLTEGGQ